MGSIGSVSSEVIYSIACDIIRTALTGVNIIGYESYGSRRVGPSGVTTLGGGFWCVVRLGNVDCIWYGIPVSTLITGIYSLYFSFFSSGHRV